MAVLLRTAGGVRARPGVAALGAAGRRAGVTRIQRGAVLFGEFHFGIFELLVGRQPVVGLANAPAHAGEQRVAEPRDLHHRLELTRPDDEDVEIGRGTHGGTAGHGLNGGQLTEMVTGMEDVDDPAGPGDGRGPFRE